MELFSIRIQRTFQLVSTVMSRNRRIVRMFSFDNRSYSLFEKKFVAGYQFMKVERNGADTVYRIA